MMMRLIEIGFHDEESIDCRATSTAGPDNFQYSDPNVSIVVRIGFPVTAPAPPDFVC